MTSNAENQKIHNMDLARKVLQKMEETVDEKIEELDSLDQGELERLRNERVLEMREAAAKKKELLSKGHGLYSEVDEKLFFKVCTDSERVLAHFYTTGSTLCEISHMHLRELAKNHVESRFVSVNADKSPFLVSRLQIISLPTIIVIINGMITDRVVCLTDFKGKEDFPREALEWRLSLKGGIKYEGNYEPTAEGKARTRINKVYKKKTIRDGEQSSDEDDD